MYRYFERFAQNYFARLFFVVSHKNDYCTCHNWPYISVRYQSLCYILLLDHGNHLTFIDTFCVFVKHLTRIRLENGCLGTTLFMIDF